MSPMDTMRAEMKKLRIKLSLKIVWLMSGRISQQSTQDPHVLEDEVPSGHA